MSSLLQRTAAALSNAGEVKLNYDYNQIPAADRQAVIAAAMEIKPRLKRAAEDIFAVGEQLNAVKERLPHGQWLPWIETEFEMAEQTARNFMNVAHRFSGKSTIIGDLPPTALYLLAAPSTPDAAVEAVVSKAQAGQKVSVKEVKQAVAEAKPKCQHCGKRVADVSGKPYCVQCWHEHFTDPFYCPNCNALSTIEKAISASQVITCWSCKASDIKAKWRSAKPVSVPPVEVRPLNQIETEAVIARLLERHYASVSDNRKIEFVLGFGPRHFVGLIQAGRSLEPSTLQAAKMAIVNQLHKRIEADRVAAKKSPLSNVSNPFAMAVETYKPHVLDWAYTECGADAVAAHAAIKSALNPVTEEYQRCLRYVTGSVNEVQPAVLAIALDYYANLRALPGPQPPAPSRQSPSVDDDTPGLRVTRVTRVSGGEIVIDKLLPAPAKVGQPADLSITVHAAADMIRSIIAAGGKHPEVDDYAAAAWAGAIDTEYGRRPTIGATREALRIVVSERAKPAPAQDEIAAISDRYARAAPQQRRNVREAVQDALLALNGVKADASALGIGSLETAINILNSIFDQVVDT